MSDPSAIVIRMSNTTTRPFDLRETLIQIGSGNLLAISGGRSRPITTQGSRTHVDQLDLPVHYGYSVRIFLAANDTYIVQRIFRRGSREWVKQEWTDVYADQIGEIAYRASCYRDN